MIALFVTLFALLLALFGQSYLKKSRPEKALSPRAFSRRLYALLGVLALESFVLRFAANDLLSTPPRNALRGNMMETTMALGEQLEKAPPPKRMELLRGYVEDPHASLRFAALDALGERYPTENADLFEKAFQDSSASVRERSMELLLASNLERGVRLLLAGMQDDDTQVRDAATQALGLLLARKPHMGDQSMVPPLIRALDDTQGASLVALTRLLSRITNKPWKVTTHLPEAQRAARIENWKRWWQTVRTTWEQKPYGAILPLQPTRSDPAPALNARDLEGSYIRLSEMRGRVVMLNFWGTWCGPCMAELPELKKTQELFRGQPFDLIGLALREPDEEKGLRQRCKELGVLYRQAICDRTIQRDFGEVTELPVTLLIDKAGRIRYRWDGARDLRTFRLAIERLLQEPMASSS